MLFSSHFWPESLSKCEFLLVWFLLKGIVAYDPF